MIIGEGGKTIKRINSNTGAIATILDDDHNDGYKAFSIRGEPDQVVMSRKIISDLALFWEKNKKR